MQAFGKVPVDVATLGVDLYSVSAHKIYAPKGTGALWIRKGVPLRGIVFGGRHERERRAGTENVAGAVAMATGGRAWPALLTASAWPSCAISLRTRSWRSCPKFNVNGDITRRLPNVSNLLFPGIAGERW